MDYEPGLDNRRGPKRRVIKCGGAFWNVLQKTVERRIFWKMVQSFPDIVYGQLQEIATSDKQFHFIIRLGEKSAHIKTGSYHCFTGMIGNSLDLICDSLGWKPLVPSISQQNYRASIVQEIKTRRNGGYDFIRFTKNFSLVAFMEFEIASQAHFAVS